MDLLVIENFAERNLRIKQQLEEVVQEASTVTVAADYISHKLEPIRRELVSLVNELTSIKSLQKLAGSSEPTDPSIEQRILNYESGIEALQSLFKQTAYQLQQSSRQATRNLLLGQKHSVGARRFGAENEAEASKKVTQSLKNLLHMVTAQVQRSTQSTRKMQESSRVLVQTHQEFKGFDRLLHESKLILKGLLASDKRDTLVVLMAFFVFLLAVLYVVKTRVLRLVTFGYL